MSWFVALIGLIALLGGGMIFAIALDAVVAAALAGRPAAPALAAPFLRGAGRFSRQSIATERPDAVTGALAAPLYAGLAACGLSVVPLAPGVVVAESPVGIVIWGACEALTVVAVFLHGWSPNAPLPLIGAYRYVAVGLPAMLLSMFVLIGAALPAESLSVTEIVAAQASLWNVALQPGGFALFLLVALSLSFRGPFDYADPADLAGGTSAEASGPARVAWEGARLAMLVSASAMAATVFLGGWRGPELPGPVWLALKTAGVIALLTLLGRLVARMPAPRMMALIWIVLLPAAFLQLALVGGGLLW